MSRPPASPLSAAVFVLLAACGGDGDGITPPPPPPPPLGVATIEVTAPAGVLAAGATLPLSAVARNAAGAVLAGVAFSWQSSAVQTATVSAQGVVQGVAAGTVTITAGAEGRSGTVPLVVRDTAALPATVSGRIERVDLTVGPGQTLRVTGDAALVADSTLVVAGTIEVEPGKSLTLYGGKLVRLTGILDGDSAAEYVIGGGRLEIEGPPAALAAAGVATLRVAGQLGGSGPTYVATKSVVVRSGGLVTAGKGADGTAASRDGGPGHNVEIGSVLARTKMANGSGRPAFPVDEILVEPGGQIVGGEGGAGFTVVKREDGESAGNTWTARAGKGGKGGDVVVIAQQIDIQQAPNQVLTRVLPGPGGQGGEVKPEFSLKLASGPEGEGEGLNAFTGSGGNGGDLIISAAVIAAGGLTLRRGEAGRGGGVTAFGGNGGASAPGGIWVLIVGGPGANGSATVPAGVAVFNSGPPLPPEILLANAFNGGRSFESDKPGGPGGFLTISGAGDAQVAIQQIKLSDVGNGGAGWNGCIEIIAPGTAGGQGGERALFLEAGPLIGRLVEEGTNFSGGPGGDGWPAVGAGGARGFQTDGPGGAGPIGEPGADGLLCPPPEPMTMHRTGVANFESGIAMVRSNGTIEAGPSTLPPLAGAVYIDQFPDEPTRLLVGTATNPGLVSATFDAEGAFNFTHATATTAPVFRAAIAQQCILVVQPDLLRSFTAPTLAPAHAVGIPNLSNLLLVGDRVFTHAGSSVAVYDIQFSDCTITLNAAPPLNHPSLVDWAALQLSRAIVGINRPLTGPGSLFLQPLVNGIPDGAATVISLPSRPFDIEADPSGTVLYMMGDLGEVTWATADPGIASVSVQGQFTLPGADRFEVVEATPEESLRLGAKLGAAAVQVTANPLKIIYTNVSNPSLGRVCSVLLGLDGIPAEAPICEQTSTRPRPDSDLKVFRDPFASLRAGAAAKGGNDASRR